MSGGTFVPHQLFASGAQGAWYDPSDFSTLYQDAAGTTPVTAVEQPVRLMLDRRKGLVLGPEAVSAGVLAFNSANWNAGAGWTANGNGTATFVAGADQNIEAVSVVTSGITYRLTITVSNLTTGSISVRVGNNSIGDFTITANGSYTLTLNADGTSILFRAQSVSGTNPTISGLSVRELPGNHAVAPNDASRPVLRARYNLLTYSEQFDNGAWQKNDGASVTANAVVAPDGTTTADQIDLSASQLSRVQQPLISQPTASYTFTVWLRVASGSVSIRFGTATNFDVITVTDTWQRFTSTKTVTTPDQPNHTIRNEAGGGAKTLYAWGAQILTAADQAATGGAYQRIAAATDYDTSNPVWRPYLAFDGSDDSFSTSSIDFNTVTSDGQPRRNLLLNPTQFDAAGWTLNNATITANAAVAPDGTTTADKMVPSTSNVGQQVFQSATIVAGIHTQSVYAKADGYSFLQFNNAQSVDFANFDLSNGTVGTTGGTVTATITALANGWYRCIVTYSAFTAGSVNFRNQIVGSSTASRNPAFQGDGTSGILIWGAQLETGSTATAFQNIGTDEMTVFAGVTKLSDAARGLVCELSAGTFVNNGSFRLAAPEDATFEYSMTSRGTVDIGANINSATYAAPNNSVLTGTADIGAPSVALRINGFQVASNATSQGTGNYGNYPLFIGRRNNTSDPFNGRLYGLTVLGRTATAPELTAMESWIAGKTGVAI